MAKPAPRVINGDTPLPVSLTVTPRPAVSGRDLAHSGDSGQTLLSADPSPGPVSWPAWPH